MPEETRALPPGGAGERLPPGRHGISREEVERNQRERMIAAMAELAAERGFAKVRVADVIARAHVSRATFYAHFENRSACLEGTFSELFERLLAEIESACAAEAAPERRTAAGFRHALALLRCDLPTAQLLTLEVLALGAPGARLQQQAIERLAGLLRGARGGRRQKRSGEPEWCAVAVVVILIARLLIAGEGERLEGLVDTLPDFVSTALTL
jgi:AcrR family transcriptional regulator